MTIEMPETIFTFSDSALGTTVVSVNEDLLDAANKVDLTLYMRLYEAARGNELHVSSKGEHKLSGQAMIVNSRAAAWFQTNRSEQLDNLKEALAKLDKMAAGTPWDGLGALMLEAFSTKDYLTALLY
jgi:hypothetical protein